MDGFFTPLIRARTYRRLLYLLLGLPLGTFYFVFLVTAVSLGVGLAIIWVGVLILVGTVAAWRAMGGFERRFTNGMLGSSIQAPPPLAGEAGGPRPGLWERIKAMLADSYTYRSFFWLLLRFPLGIAGFTIAVTGLAVTVGFLAAPIALTIPGATGRFDAWQDTQSIQQFDMKGRSRTWPGIVGLRKRDSKRQNALVPEAWFHVQESPEAANHQS